ncbi:MAG: DUF4175 family protein [Rhodothalassiaceae bacterium]
MKGRAQTADEIRLRAEVRHRLAVVRACLVLERLWRLVWPAAVLVAFYASAALFGLLAALPVTVHGLLFGLLGGGVILLLWRGAKRTRWPDEREARRRLEADNAASHRPLDALFDDIAMSGGGAALWRRYRRVVAARALALRPHPPRLSLSAEDPRALRALAAFALLVGFLHAGSDSARRLAAGFLPSLAERGGAPLIDAWITPPDYTGRSPIVLSVAGESTADDTRAGIPLDVPAGSTLIARVQGAAAAPRMVLGDRRQDFTRAGEADYRLEAPLEASGRLEFRLGRRVAAHWPIAILADRPPVIGFTRPPGETPRHSLRIDYTLLDDYGVTEARLELTPREIEGPPLVVALRGGTMRDEPLALTAYKDLTAHVYAGSAVTAVLKARDAAGQEAASAAMVIRLPERRFTHPVARALVAVRKTLVRAPEAREQAAERVDAISRDIGSYDGDLTVFAALRSSFWRLMESGEAAAAANEVAALLWDTALRLEDGQVSLAARSLSESLEALEEALSGAPEDLAAAADRLARSMQEFLSQLARQQGGMAPRMAENRAAEATVIGADMLQDMVRQIQRLAAAGETDAARRMLAALREIMENATTDTLSPEDYKRAMAAGRAQRALEKLGESQQDALNDTSRQALLNRLLAGQKRPQRGYGPLASEQRQLEATLDGVRRQLEGSGVESPEALSRAATAMREAARALDADGAPQAIHAQSKAVQALAEAAKALGQAARRAMASMPGAGGLDPLGRPYPGLSTRDWLLPDKAGMRAARRILEELRRRISDPAIPPEERDYLRRLLRRF